MAAHRNASLRNGCYRGRCEPGTSRAPMVRNPLSGSSAGEGHLRFSLLGRIEFAQIPSNSVVAGWSANPIQHTFHGLLRGGRPVLFHANAAAWQLEEGLWATLRKVRLQTQTGDY